MHITMVALLSLVAALLQPGPPQEASDKVFSASAFVYEDGELLGAPTLTLREGLSGSVMVEGQSAYALELTVRRATLDDIQAFQLSDAAGRLSASARVLLPQDGDWREVARPTILLSEGSRGAATSDIYSQNFRRTAQDSYSQTVTVELVVTEVDESWLYQSGGQKAIASCSFDTLEDTKSTSNAASEGLVAAAGGDCCDNGCIRCCGGCCSDAANCRAGCCP